MRTEEELSPLGPVAQSAALSAALRIARVQLRYARQGIGMAQVALAGARHFEPLRHYPAGDVICRDPATGEATAQFYYHAHASSRRPHDEHGHFHLFARNSALTGGFCHIAGLSLDIHGRPLRWFTTNRWVTGEHWVDAPTVIDALPRLRIASKGRLGPLADWLDALVALHRDDLRNLLLDRDEHMASRLAGEPAESVFEDRGLDVINECPIHLDARLQALA